MADADISNPEPSDEETSEEEFNLEQFVMEDDDQGLSLDELSQAYAEMIGTGEQVAKSGDANATQATPELDEPEEVPSEGKSEADDDYPVRPQNIVEAILFVGHPEGEPLTSKQLAALMRGVRPAEINELVQELNEEYQNEGCPYTIASVGPGYKMQLCDEYVSLRNKFYGRVREARLSQAAVDVLSVVAYQQGTTKEDVDSKRGKASGALLNQLVRRQLLRIERPAEKKRTARYYTTDRFLHLLGLESVEDLPRSQDLDRNL